MNNNIFDLIAEATKPDIKEPKQSYQVTGTNCRLSGSSISIHRESDLLTNEIKGDKILIYCGQTKLFSGTEPELIQKLLL